MRGKRKCELCSNEAAIYCESDQASLCYECDSKVHGANFLVAKHSRTLLCHVCQSPTPWTGSGPKLGPTFSVCQTCHKGVSHDDDHNDRGMMMNVMDDDNDDGNEDDDVDEDGDDDVEYEDDDDDEDEDNQVVPWSYSVSHP